MKIISLCLLYSPDLNPVDYIQDLAYATRTGVQEQNQGRPRATRMHRGQNNDYKLDQRIVNKAVVE